MSLDRIQFTTLMDPGAGDLRARISRSIREGAVFVYPTETIYGVGGIVDPAVEERIRVAKGRPRDNPMIALAGRREILEAMGVMFPPAADRLACRFWPGNLTLVLPARSAASGIAVRVSPHPFVRFVDETVGRPIYSTSANLSGTAYVNNPDAIARVFAGTADFMIDAGVLPESKPSTVVRVDESGGVTVLREGAVSREEILKAAG